MNAERKKVSRGTRGVGFKENLREAFRDAFVVRTSVPRLCMPSSYTLRTLRTHTRHAVQFLSESRVYLCAVSTRRCNNDTAATFRNENSYSQTARDPLPRFFPAPQIFNETFFGKLLLSPSLENLAPNASFLIHGRSAVEKCPLISPLWREFRWFLFFFFFFQLNGKYFISPVTCSVTYPMIKKLFITSHTVFTHCDSMTEINNRITSQWRTIKR